MDFNGKLEGFSDFDKLLRQLPQRIENNVIQGAATGALRIGAKAVKSRAPVHLEFQSAASKKYGPLKVNIKVKQSKRDRQKGQRGAYITTGDAFWGYIYEKGSRYQTARPWFLPAFTGAVPAMLKEVAKRLGDGIIREASKQNSSGAAVRDAIDGL